MAKLSIIIPARNEEYLKKTVEGLIQNAAGEIEIIAVVDGPTAHAIPDAHLAVTVLHHEKAAGMRQCINEAVALSTGDYVMKCDAHCLFGPAYDEILKADCEDNWLVVPRRYALDPERWGIDLRQSATDAHSLRYPWIDDPPCFHGQKWPERTLAHKDILIDDEMDSQGSCWFMHRSHFQPMDFAHYGDFFQEFQELGLRTWMGGGRVVVNKRTYYAHWHKPRDHGRGYFISSSQKAKAERFSFDYWWNNRWADRKRDFEWYIDHFMPIPTWPDDWKVRHGLA